MKSFQANLLECILQMEDELISVWRCSDLELVYRNTFFAANFGEQSKNLRELLLGSIQMEEVGQKVDNILYWIETLGRWHEELTFRNVIGKSFSGRVRFQHFEFGGILHIVLRIIDMQELHDAIESLKQEKDKFQALFQFASMGIIVTSKNGQIVLANDFARSLFGYGEEILQLFIEDLIPKRFREKHVHYREDYREKPQNRPMGVGMSLFASRKDGTEFSVEVSLSNYKTNQESFTIAFLIDISKRKEIEETMVRQKIELERINREIEHMNDELEEKVVTRTMELQETLAQLERSKSELEVALSKEKELSDMKSRFVSMASHEFRTPLSTILSSASLVAKYTQADEQNKRDKHIQRIRSAVSNMTDILNDFLSIGKIEEGRIVANFSKFNIEEQISLVCNEIMPILRSGQKISYKHEGIKTVNLDLSLMRNVMINLISNAIKFSPEGAKIEVRTDVNEKRILISVSDHGIGIPEEDKKHLFERFFRAKNVTNIQGTGLGLHILARYIELMNGHIAVDSELEKGTTFTIEFPLEPYV
ncbi:MAG: ATP-binding protein [Chitinophagaceae bacterium]